MKSLVTNNGNLLVKKEEKLFGFFNEEGKLLRESNAQEFSWAESKMPEYSGSEINFDFSSLEERLRLVKEEAMNQLASFTGMPEEVIQKILDCFKGSPEELRISGQLGIDWFAYNHVDSPVGVWGILPDGKVSYILSSRYEDYSSEYIMGKEPDAKFFIVDSHGDWEIFKAPNMRPVLEARREDAVSKLNDFLLNFQNNLDSKKIYEAIKQTGILDTDLLNASVSEIGSGWVVEGVSTGGCAYHDHYMIKAWAICKNGQMFEVDNKVITENADQNANGSWSDSYGYTFKYLMKKAPEALFFILNEVHDRQADKQPDVYENKWSLLRPLTRKEIMIEKINSAG